MKIAFHDNGLHKRLAPLTLTRPVIDLRMGLFTNRERWLLMMGRRLSDFVHFSTEEYLKDKYPLFDEKSDYLHLNAEIVPDAALVDEVQELKMGEELRSDTTWIARKGSFDQAFEVKLCVNYPLVEINGLWDLFQKNASVLASDFHFHTSGRQSRTLSASNTVIGDPKMIFIEEGAEVEAAILNTNSGPIYIGANAHIMEGSMIRGPLALSDYAEIKMGTKIYGATSIGPHCKVGGEVSNSIFIGYSNKGHDGFLGNSLVGEWCNLGADTNSSNLKNNYGKVKVYSYEKEAMIQTDVQFLGLIMGDHSKCGINTMFNTATSVGVSANIFGADFPPKFVPSFAWGIFPDTKFDLYKAYDAADGMMKRRGLSLSPAEKSILRHLHELE